MAVTRSARDNAPQPETEATERPDGVVEGLVPSPAVAGPNGDYRSDVEKQADAAKAPPFIGEDRPVPVTADGLAAAVNAANERERASVPRTGVKPPSDHGKIDKIVREWAYEFSPEAKTNWQPADDNASIAVTLVTIHGVTNGKAPVAGWSDAQVSKALDMIRREQILV